MARKVLILSMDEYYGTFFLEGADVINYVHENDAQWRDEYFNGFMRKLDIEVTSRATKEQLEAIKTYAEKYNLA